MTPQAKSAHTVQYYEFAGNRGIYKDGWYAATRTNCHGKRKLAVPSGTTSGSCTTPRKTTAASTTAATEPAKLTEMQDAFLAEAFKYNVLPLDERFHERITRIAGRPGHDGGQESLTVYPGMVGMTENAFIDVKNRSSSITADVEVPPDDVSGVIVAQGGMHAGWSLYVKDGLPRLGYNFLGQVTTITGDERLPSGRVTLGYDFAYDGGNRDPVAQPHCQSTGNRSPPDGSSAPSHSSSERKQPT